MREREVAHINIKMSSPSNIITLTDNSTTSGKGFSDVIYGTISMSALDLSFIDNPMFQRLDGLRQLGIAHRVYKGAVHTRKDHSIGVAHLSELWMLHLARTQPSLEITSRQIALVKLGGLLHDLGHLAYSHSFDTYIAPALLLEPPGDSKMVEHEYRSEQLVRYMVETEDSINLTPDEVDFVVAVMHGDLLEGHPPFLFELVANASTSIDSDKMDYLQRDAYFCGFSSPGFQPLRIIGNSRVVDGHICFRRKVYMDIFHMFQARFYFHREVYRHRTVMILESMLVSAIALAGPYLDVPLKHRFADIKQWSSLSDFSIWYEIVNCTSQHADVIEARAILDRIDRRQLTHEGVLSSVIAYTGSGENPMTDVWFYEKTDVETRFHVAPKDVSICFPTRFSEIKNVN